VSPQSHRYRAPRPPRHVRVAERAVVAAKYPHRVLATAAGGCTLQLLVPAWEAAPTPWELQLLRAYHGMSADTPITIVPLTLRRQSEES